MLSRLGFEYRKPKALPRVASVESQAAFIALYEKLMRDLPADEAVYFADAVHPEYQSKPAFGWGIIYQSAIFALPMAFWYGTTECH